jgi:hypothetical protein
MHCGIGVQVMDNSEPAVQSPQEQLCLSTFMTHWAKAQLDGPMQIVARYDDVAKLLITIGGFLLGVMASSYSAMLRDRSVIDMEQARGKSQAIFIVMLIFFLSAALVCFWQPKTRAAEILKSRNDKDIEQYIHLWCENLRRTILWKRAFLGIATFAFIASFLLMISLLLNTF